MRACWNHIRAFQNHIKYRNYTLHVGIILERVEITLMSVIFNRIRIKLTLVCAESTQNYKIFRIWFTGTKTYFLRPQAKAQV
jgi:hypothetical protein